MTQLDLYKQAINQIDDYLEYEYRGHPPALIKYNIMEIIDDLAEGLKNYRESRQS